VAGGRAEGEVVIGYRCNSAGEPPVVNPAKSTPLVLSAEDEVIVIARAATTDPAAPTPAPAPNRVPVPTT